MKRIIVIVKFEYLSRIRKGIFLFATIISPILLMFALAFPFLAIRLSGSDRHMLVLDQSGVSGLFESIKRKAEEAPPEMKYTFSQVIVPPDQNINQFRLKFNFEIENDSSKTYLVLRQGILDGVSPEYYTSNALDVAFENINRSINWAVTNKRLEHGGVDPERYTKPIVIKTIKLGPAGEGQWGVANLITPILIFMITHFAISGYGTLVMGGIVEEKHARIMEVLVSSAKPFEMMMGKLIGIGLVGLTQYLIWAIASIPIFLSLGVGLAAQGVALNSISASSIFLFVIYFTLGYFLFASLYLIGGALVTDTEGGNIVNRFMLVMMSTPPVVLLPVVQNPGGAIAVTLSLIPFFGAGIMILRIGISSPPLWQILLSLILMIMTIGASLWVAAKVYRAGILIYGKKPSLPEIIRWLRHA